MSAAAIPSVLDPSSSATVDVIDSVEAPPPSGPSPLLSVEDARLFYEVTEEESLNYLSLHQWRELAQSLKNRITTSSSSSSNGHDGGNAEAAPTSGDGRFNGGASPSVVPSSCAALLAAFTPAVLQRLIGRMGNLYCSAQPNSFAAHVLLALCSVEGLATRLVEAGILPVCDRIMCNFSGNGDMMELEGLTAELVSSGWLRQQNHCSHCIIVRFG